MTTTTTTKNPSRKGEASEPFATPVPCNHCSGVVGNHAPGCEYEAAAADRREDLRARLAHVRDLVEQQKMERDPDAAERAEQRAAERAERAANPRKRPPYHVIVNVNGNCKRCGKHLVESSTTKSGWTHEGGWKD